MDQAQLPGGPMKTVKVLVGKGGQAGITCPYCQKTHLVSVDKFKEAKHTIISKCSCQERFKVELNFRQLFRKDVKLAGKIINLSTGSRDWYAVTIVNVSMGGLRFKVIGSTDIEEGHQLRVNFTLDNKKATEIDREVEVTSRKDNQIGCEFLNLDYEKDLGFYLGT